MINAKDNFLKGVAVMKHVLAVAQLALCLVFVFYGSGGGGTMPSELVGQWEHASGVTKRKPEKIELFNDGTGVVDGASVTWKVEDKRFVILSSLFPSLFVVSCNYKVSGYELSLEYNDQESAIFVRKGKLEEFKEKRRKAAEAERAERAKQAKSYKYTGRTVKIGGQTWMAENLNSEAAGGKCYENAPSNCAKYGRLYTWEEAVTACPSGWHLPTDAEWTTLENTVGGSNTAGKKLKSKSGWNNNGNGTDEYGFSALPGGFGNGGYFNNVGDSGHWWSATEYAASYAWDRNIYYEGVYRSYDDGLDKSSLYSVRCLQD